MTFKRLLSVALVATLASCGDSTTAPSTGGLTVAIGGLPPGAHPAVTVTGPNAYSIAVMATTTTLSSLRNGTYTVAALEVTANGNRYTPRPATQTVVVSNGVVSVATPVAYEVSSAKLRVTVLGVPSGTAAGVTLTGPGGLTRTIDATTTIELLAPGNYTVSAASVQAGGKTYRAAPTTQAVTLTASASLTEATVAYGAGNGTLDLTIAGLPASTDGSVTVTGPNGYSRTLPRTTSIQYLEPGTYTVAAATVGSSLTTHAATPTTQTVGVTDGTTSTATVTYGSAPLQLALQLVADNLTNASFVTAPDGDSRLFIVERRGRVKLYKDGALLPTPFLDISARVNSVDERGMLSMTFDPQYATNGYVYVYYVALNGDMVVERISSTAGNDVAGPSAGIVIQFAHGGANHHGGLITFGPDGMLYVAPGDGGCCGDPQNNAQNLTTLLGKILRIDVHTLPYTIPADNPYVDRTGVRKEIWAYGLRNPWRYSFDAEGGKLYIGDVGQDAHEEVDVVSASDAGLNFGWRLMEGTACYNPSTNCNPGGSITYPVLEYPHSDGCSVIGGYVYRGSAIPELTGHYFYSDYCRGWVRSFRSVGTLTTDRQAWASLTVANPLSFGHDGAGEQYIVSASKVWKIVRQ
jgi:glucose/arabinose dehydrogenase